MSKKEDTLYDKDGNVVYTVYLIGNNVDDKVYIGYTSLKLHKRMQLHRTNGDSKPLLGHIKDVGLKHFYVKEVAKTPSLKKAKKIERNLILSHNGSKFNTKAY